MKAIEQYFHVLLIIVIVHELVLVSNSVEETLVCGQSNTSFEKYFHVALFIMLYKVVLAFKSVGVTLVCDHLNESYRAVRSCGAVCCAVQGGSNFSVCG